MLNIESAEEYVANYFAKAEWDSECAPPFALIGAQVSTEADGAIDVRFALDGVECVMTVWVERYPNVAPFLYGEW